MQIAIDGPAGSGKSTIAKILADKAGFIYLDTGAMYRGAAWLKQSYELDYPALCKMIEDVDYDFADNGRTLRLKYKIGLVVHSEDVTERIRTPEITAMVSEVAANASLRKVLTAKQREIADKSNVVMDGRDIGTVVLPMADVKIFLTASPEVRAKRRLLEWEAKGQKLDYTQVLSDIIERDRLDSTRETAPLKKAADAVEIDTSAMTIEEVAEAIKGHMTKK
ncbi:MAG: (d)CMP kinase [Deferribacteraceae bacterium]|jgi:cytidylate kinase|nr:(d)CMP kinase [Deferribacteraceae bacterium]